LVVIVINLVCAMMLAGMAAVMVEHFAFGVLRRGFPMTLIVRSALSAGRITRISALDQQPTSGSWFNDMDTHTILACIYDGSANMRI
jgi:hypothetical protein